LLSSDHSHGELNLDPSYAEPAFDEAFRYTENSIEAWAVQDLPSFEGTSASLSETSGTSTIGITEQLCYGMVRCSDLWRFPLGIIVSSFVLTALIPPLGIPRDR
jgi:hypothetical protein